MLEKAKPKVTRHIYELDAQTNKSYRKVCALLEKVPTRHIKDVVAAYVESETKRMKITLPKVG